MARELEKVYEPKAVEDRWYKEWVEKGYFHADPAKEGPAFSIVIPPPNVTGVLHMGHALNNTLQDALCRWKRMRGFNVLWMPGTDHAGIATQNVVERQLAAEGTTRHAYGREKFIQRVWQWREESGGTIINQLKRLGASCDWERERFTMDEGLSRSVREVFVRLYEEGLIYRGDYIINWCPRCMTALSDLEVEFEEKPGKLYHLKYPLVDGTGVITVATTRPETMLGDTAVAVNPEDDRYKHFIGKRVMLPVSNREIPVIADAYVDPAFGTGAVKITPAHDPNDFEIGIRHNLNRIRVMDDEGKMTEEAGKYAGMDRFECRGKLLLELDQTGVLGTVEEHLHAVGHCYRCRTVIEPAVSKQWFVKVEPLAKEAIKAVREGIPGPDGKVHKINILPKGWENSYFDWMENIRDWCISRQIWWGHRIPAWHCDECGELTVAREDPVVCGKCGSRNIRRDPDVLDTWFSSALWPFSTMGWPDNTPELKKYYPTAVLVTAFDILFFWVARMIMMGIHFMDEPPFTDVYIHALVRDAQGQKMSKSKGNVIDPLVMIDKYGTDAFRFTMVAMAAQGRDIKLSEERIEGYRNFCNKIWNAARFVHMNLGEFEATPLKAGDAVSLPDRWIVSRMDAVAAEVDRALTDYRFNDAAGALYQFVWHEFCDWYLELIKPVLYGDEGLVKSATLNVLVNVFEGTMRMLHPFMPFITEEVWQSMPLAERDASVMVSKFPEANDALRNEVAESEMKMVIDIITGIRNIRGEMNIAPSLELTAVVKAASPEVKAFLDAQGNYITKLSRLKEMTVETEVTRPKASAVAVTPAAEIYIPLTGVVDIEAEVARLKKEIDKADKEIKPFEAKLANEGFVKKAPPEVLEKTRGIIEELTQKKEKLAEGLKRIEGFKE
ncbi:MAG: valine--tRNA ligase [Nitrospirae bacterium]|nr:valine--tRNA ligase [Nitrospirota bacterium]